GQAQEQHGCNDDLERVPNRLAKHGPPRCREIADGKVAGDDPWPEPGSADHECRDANTDRWPEGGHGAVEVGEVKTGARGSVVEPRYDSALDRVQDEAAGARLHPRLQAPGQRTRFPLEATQRLSASTYPEDRPLGDSAKGARPPQFCQQLASGSSQFRPPTSVGWTGDLGGPQSRATTRGRSRAWAGLHPRRSRFAQDDDDHAAGGQHGRKWRLRR